MSGSGNKPKEQPKECGCACNGLVLEMLQAMTAQSKLMAEQNKLMAQIVDQNNQLLVQLESDEPNVQVKSQYLDG